MSKVGILLLRNINFIDRQKIMSHIYEPMAYTAGFSVIYVRCCIHE
ncbi:MAG: hypothetical protein ISS28_00950 [Candidatus Cloacimonetes bacterium]|nr:hypothetical protein [Candidatus Cloacimonadota bacterium]